MRVHRTLPSLLILSLFASACEDDDSPDVHDHASGEDTGHSHAEVTYWDHVAPLMAEHCGSCHRDGGAAPFTLTNYESAKLWANASVAAMQSRTMPPWLMTADGSCGEFRDARWLDQSVIDTVAAWAGAGAPEGTPRTDIQVPPLSQLADAVTLSTPVFVPEIAGGELAEFDEYRCFMVDPELAADAFLTGFNVLPGNDAIVHHVLGMPVDPHFELPDGRTNLEVMQGYDDESPDRPGWPCFGAAGDDVEIRGIPVSWAPGQGVVDFPDGVGVRVGTDDVVVLQVHYNLANPDTIGQSDQTHVQLRLEPTVEREGYYVLPDPLLDSIYDEPILLEPGNPNLEFTWEAPMAWFMPEGLEAIDIFGGFPHMHEFGRKMHVSLVGADSSMCMGDVPRWDFAWQLYYFYEQPLRALPTDTLRVTCTYDTTSVTEPIFPGWGTRNEMCLFGLLLVP